MILSFILVPFPDYCEGEAFKLLFKFGIQTPEGVKTELVSVVAMNCRYVDEVIPKLKAINEDYFHRKPSEIVNDTVYWTSACRSVLLGAPYGMKLTEPVKKALAQMDINIEDEYCVYIQVEELLMQVTMCTVSGRSANRG